MGSPIAARIPMLVPFTFRAKAGREKEFEGLLNNPESGRLIGRMMGATRNALFLHGGRMIRVLEMPEGIRPTSMGEIAAREPKVLEFLRALGPLIEDGFDVDRPDTLEAFNRRAVVPVAYDVQP